MYKRYVSSKISIALEDTPAVIVVGPRQSGKTTLIREFVNDDWSYVTLDDVNQLQFAKADPVGFIRNFTSRHVVIDEIQRVPELMLPLKQSIDENRQPGRFLLSGSANAMVLPRVADSLAGRLEVINLFPLSECEIQNKTSTFLTKLLNSEVPQSKDIRIRDELLEKVCKGGFPEALERTDSNRRMAWFQQYITSIIQKDLSELADIEHLNVMAKLVHIFSNQIGQLLDYTSVAKSLELPRQTVKRYLELLKQLFIFQELPAWHSNQNKRLIKTPKIHIVDSGLLCGLNRITNEKLKTDRQQFGRILENYIFCELQKMASWLDEPLYFYHYRDKDKVEVDVVIETVTGDVIGIEIKAGATIGKADFQGLMRLEKAAGDKFKMGVVLYDGDHSNQFTEKIYSVPLGSMWE